MSGSHFNKPKFATQQSRSDSRNNNDQGKIPVIEWTADGTPNSHSTASIPSSLRFYTSSQERERNAFSLPNLIKKKERERKRKREDGAWVSEGQLTSCFICHWIFRCSSPPVFHSAPTLVDGAHFSCQPLKGPIKAEKHCRSGTQRYGAGKSGNCNNVQPVASLSGETRNSQLCFSSSVW